MLPKDKLLLLSTDDTARKAIEMIESRNFLSLPVTDQGKYVGYLSKQYIFDTYFKSPNIKLEEFLERPVRDFVHNKVNPVTPDVSVEEVANLFFNNKLRFIPVVSKIGVFEGIITQQSLFGILTKIYGLYGPKISIYTDDFKGALSKIADTIARQGGNIINIAHLDTEVLGIREISIRLEDTADLQLEKIVKKLQEKGFKIQEYSV